MPNFMLNKALFFKIDNKRDKCAFCGNKEAAVMGMASGLCLCAKCINTITDLMKLEAPADEVTQISESSQFRLEHKPATEEKTD